MSEVIYINQLPDINPGPSPFDIDTGGDGNNVVIYRLILFFRTFEFYPKIIYLIIYLINKLLSESIFFNRIHF